ncbi:MAG: hypothetical protein AAGA42_10775 [Actinomycetota bacterium]
MSMRPIEAAVAVRHQRPREIDFWIAVAAGEHVWADPDKEVGIVERVVAVTEIAALATVATIAGVRLATTPLDGLALVAPWVAIAGASLLAVRPLRVCLGRRRAGRLWPSFALRVAVVIAILASMATAPVAVALLALWPFALALGAEAAACAWELGFDIRPACWCRTFVTSAFHVGIVVAAVIAFVVLGAQRGIEVIAPVYLGGALVVILGSFFAGVLDRFRRSVLHHERAAVAEAAADAHRRSAHWLHDDVSSALKLTELQIRHEGVSPESVADALAELDHRIRLRQLDELYMSGSVRLAEVLQPYVRNAQSQGVAIGDVPTFDDASTVVDEPLGRMFGRAVAVLTSNALLAGATELGYTVTSTDEAITLQVSDNAGGFDLAEAPAGRGLWQLSLDLGTDGVEVVPNGAGSTVTVTMPRHRERELWQSEVVR